MEIVCDQPLISVIVPVYKTEPYIRKCVDSILTQTHTNLEVFLIDDGSPDHCPAICDEYGYADHRVNVIHKENGGVSSARNAALEISHGKFVAFVDSDDYLEKDYFSELIKFDADVVVSGQQAVTGTYGISDVKENFYAWGGFTGPCEKLYKREKIFGLKFREDLPVGEDIIFNLAVLNRIESVHYTPYRGYHIEKNPNSLTRACAGKYDILLDEPWQKKWGQIHGAALRETGISQNATTAVNIQGCSVWIFQKIKNYCYPDCPHPYSERIKRIKNQLDGNRDMILQVKEPTSPRTYWVVRLCVALKNPHLAYGIFRLLVALGK